MGKEQEITDLGGGMTEGGGNNDTPLWPDEPDSGEITPSNPPLKPKDNQEGNYKEASNKAKLAVLKRDILGDGVKESKLKKIPRTIKYWQ